jgi:hypothetical protein
MDKATSGGRCDWIRTAERDPRQQMRERAGAQTNLCDGKGLVAGESRWADTNEVSDRTPLHLFDVTADSKWGKGRKTGRFPVEESRRSR